MRRVAIMAAASAVVLAGTTTDGAYASSVQQSCFSNGSGTKLFKWCTSTDGNLLSLVGPSGREHLAYGSVDEGYAICSADNEGQTRFRGYDYGEIGASGFGTSSRVQPGGPNTLPLTITRLTTDGVWQLTQTYARNNTEREVVITMSLKNLSAVVQQDVSLIRLADFDVDGFPLDNIGDAAAGAAWMRTSNATMLEGLTFGVTRIALIALYGQHEELGAGSRCGITGATPAAVPTTVANDYIALVAYVWPSIAAGATKTVKFQYRIA